MKLYNWLKFNLTKFTAGTSLLSCFILMIIKIFFSLSFLPDISGSETSTIFPVQFLADGRAIYSNPEVAPFRFTQYTPIYLIITGFIFQTTGFSPEDVHKVFIVNRFLSMGFTTLAACVVAFIITKLSGRKNIIGIIAGCLVFQVLAFWILTSSRPDSLVVLLTTLYVATVYKAITTHDKKDLWFILAIFISVTAFFVKQSGTIHAIALGAFCIYQKQWKLLVKLVFSGLCFFGIYLLILPIESTKIFFSNIVGGVNNSSSWHWFYDWTLEKFLMQFAPLIVCNFLISFRTFAKDKSALNRFFAVASLAFFAFATATAFKVGAGVGYYQDYLILAVIQITLFLTDPVRRKWFRARILKSLLASYILIVSIHCTLFVYMSYQSEPAALYRHQYTQEREIARFLKDEKELADNEWIYVCDSEQFQGLYLKHFLFRNVLIPFTDIIYIAHKTNTFNFQEFENMVKHNKIRFVVSKKGEKPRNILGYEFPDLKKIKTFDAYDIYEQ